MRGAHGPAENWRPPGRADSLPLMGRGWSHGPPLSSGACGRLALSALFSAAVACTAPLSRAVFLPQSEHTLGDPADAPASRYARLDRAACEAELGRRAIAFSRVDEARGVLAPVRLSGALHGVTYGTGLAEKQRASSLWEIVDCRLALALDDFAAMLEQHDVVRVVHYSIYRPPARAWPADKIASRHPGALAIDAAKFVKRDGSTLVVERDFHGRIGAPTCDPGAGPAPATPEALELRAILCDAAHARLFHVMLTPDYNWPHRNHFHLEVTAGVRWFLVH